MRLNNMLYLLGLTAAEWKKDNEVLRSKCGSGFRISSWRPCLLHKYGNCENNTIYLKRLSWAWAWWYTTIILAFRRVRQDLKFESSMGYRARSSIKNKNQNTPLYYTTRGQCLNINNLKCCLAFY
jgi:hypothetical protein